MDVFHRCYDGLIHAFLNLFGLSQAADAAVGEMYAELSKFRRRAVRTTTTDPPAAGSQVQET
ncbi:hypothetical protein ACWDYJ_12820 [Streptomyces sp. NPDC003042]